MAKVDPYLVERKDEAGVDFIEDTPQYIKELHEECRRAIDDLLNIWAAHESFETIINIREYLILETDK